MAELKPCPFCGAKKPNIEYDEKFKRYSVRCCICAATMRTTSQKRQDTVDAWNRRAGDGNHEGRFD